jgi:hypothetical protein
MTSDPVSAALEAERIMQPMQYRPYLEVTEHGENKETRGLDLSA